MECPNCKHVNTVDAKFCNQCTYDLSSIKIQQSKAYTKPKSYTPKFLADKILKSKNSIVGERKLVTVLFADVANYTSMSEKLDPEDVHQIMDGCFKILMDEIHKNNGTINQFTGDGVMAIFGAPLALEDHAQDACRAALAIQKSIKAYNKILKAKYSINFQMRIGINSGAVVVGSIGDDLRMDYTAIGDTTNLAARMESIAIAGTVLVSPNTYKKVRLQFELQSLGEKEVKGKEKPLEVYKLIKDKVYRPRLGQERQIYSEMVGRENDLNKLELQVTKAIDGDGSVVNIIGEAGIGKSRIIAELKKSNVMKRVTLLEGRAISIGRNFSFHPIIDLLKNWVRISEDDSEASALAKLEKAVRGVTQDCADEIIPFVATLMGMQLTGRYAERVKGIEGEALEKLILKNVKDLVTKSTELTPLVVVIEDLHWADTSSIELLESLFRLAETQRILFINVFRPRHKETGERVIDTIKEKLPVYYVEINIAPLNERMGETLIDNMLNIKGLHHGIKGKILQRAGGNPFFIEEVVRSFIDEGAVAIKNGNFEVTEKMDRIIIPHTISDVLMARIDRLEDETRDLLKVASVIGRNFFHRILTEVAKPVGDIDSRISHLKEIQLIRERKRMEELEYLFKHALAQEAAYESILQQKRKVLHLKVADAIAHIFKEKLHEFYGMLAYHYSMGGNEEKAEEYLLKAGEESMRSSASNEALYYYKEALNLYQKKHGDEVDLEKLSMIEGNIALALYNKGRYYEALEYFVKGLEYYGEKLPARPFAIKLKFISCLIEILFSLYFPFFKFKKNPAPKDLKYVHLCSKKIESLSQTDPTRFFIESFYLIKNLVRFDLAKVENGIGILSGFSAILSFTGISFRLSRKVLNFSKDRLNKDDIKVILFYEMVSLIHEYYKGEWHNALPFDDKLADNNLGVGEIFVTSNYLIYHGQINTDRGRFAEAKAMADKLSEIASTYENDIAKVYKIQLSLKLKMASKDFNGLSNEIEEGITFANKIDLNQYINYFYTIRAQLQIALQDMEGAEQSLFHAKEYLSVTKDLPHFYCPFLVCQFTKDLFRLEASIQSKDHSTMALNRKKAFLTGRKSLKVTKKVSCYQTNVLKLMGRYYWLIGRQKKALSLWSKSVKTGEKLGARPELSRTYLEIGKSLLDPENKYKEWKGMSAQEYLDKARSMFQEMGLHHDLDELERITATN